MRVLVVSDSHGHYKTLYDILTKQPAPIDAVFFLGDGKRGIQRIGEEISIPIYAVRGNCDGFWDAPSFRREVMEGKTIFMCHGHEFDVKSTTAALYSEARDADIILYGHTHRPQYEWRGKSLLLCPGAVCGNRMTGQAGYALLEWSETAAPYMTLCTWEENR